MVVHSILHPSQEELSLPYLVIVEGWNNIMDLVVDALTRKLGNGVTVQDVPKVVVEAVEELWEEVGEELPVSFDARALLF